MGSGLFEAVGYRLTLDVEAALFVVNALIYTGFTLSDLRREKKKSALLERSIECEEEKAPLNQET